MEHHHAMYSWVVIHYFDWAMFKFANCECLFTRGYSIGNYGKIAVKKRPGLRINLSFVANIDTSSCPKLMGKISDQLPPPFTILMNQLTITCWWCNNHL